MPKPVGFLEDRKEYSLYLFSKENKFRHVCIFVTRQKAFDYIILLFIALNCITLAMERPSIPPFSKVFYYFKILVSSLLYNEII